MFMHKFYTGNKKKALNNKSQIVQQTYLIMISLYPYFAMKQFRVLKVDCRLECCFDKNKNVYFGNINIVKIDKWSCC